MLAMDEMQEELNEKQLTAEMTKVVSRIKTHMVLEPTQAFWATLMLRLDSKADWSSKTMWTDGVSMGFNPLFIKWLFDKYGQADGERALTFCIAHEVLHCAMQHMVRRNDRDHNLFNVACDYAVNLVLEDAGFFLLEDILIDEKYRGMNAEEIYSRLQQEMKQNKKKDGKGQRQGGQGGDKDGDGDSDGKSQQQKEMEKKAQFGEVRDHPGDQGQDGGKSKGKKLSQAEKQRIANDWAVAVGNAAKQHQKACGDLPGGMKRLVEEIVDPKVHWADLVREWADRVTRDDFNWRAPNKRYMAQQGIYLPCMYSEEIGTVVIILDVSGSISDPQYQQFASEISGILMELNCEVVAMYVDTDVRRVDYFTQEDLPLRIETTGGGGTDFRPGFEEVEKLDLDPVGLIYFTDMECNRFPEKTPEYPVIWVKYGPENSWSTKADDVPFGEYIEM